MPVEELPDWQDELTPEQLDLFRRTANDPAELVARLREDTAFLEAVARADTRPHLVFWFSELGITRTQTGWTHDAERTGPIGPNAVGIEWSWEGVHDDKGRDGGFNNIAPSDRPVTVHGFTLMGVEDNRFMVRRYVDWAGLFAQLGLTLNWRTPVPAEPVSAQDR